MKIWLAALLIAVSTACSSESSQAIDAAVKGPDAANTTKDAGVADAGGVTDGMGGDAAGHGDAVGDIAAAALFGAVSVELFPDYTGFLAIFFDGPSSALTPLDVRQEQAGCQLLVPRAVTCAPACAPDAVCTGTNVCTARPQQVDVGVLHVEGLGGMNHDVEPTAPNVLTYQIVPSLPFPSCNEGDDVKVSATGFALASKCIFPLTVTSPAPIPVIAGQPTRLAWMPPGRAGISRIQIALEISHHGGFKGEIDCDVPDTGSFDIPAPLITALVNLGRAGYPTVKVMRTSTAAAPTQPAVTLTVLSQVEREVDTGVISCGGGNSPPCPTGASCQGDFICGPMK